MFKPLIDEDKIEVDPYNRLGFSDMVQRRIVLRETIEAFDLRSRHYYQQAKSNLKHWSNKSPQQLHRLKLLVVPKDWGETTQTLTREYGKTFAVLNMANAIFPGGGYIEGHAAQEENIFRRTDCHFSLTDEVVNPETGLYRVDVHHLISGTNGETLLDLNRPRVCIRGPEDIHAPGFGYAWLQDEDIFPFYELRSAAIDLRDGKHYDHAEMNKRICAQFDTLEKANVRHLVLGAFGCGAFGNPAKKVAEIYQKQIAIRQHKFDVIAFAILKVGYGEDNFADFFNAMEALSNGQLK